MQNGSHKEAVPAPPASFGFGISRNIRPVNRTADAGCPSTKRILSKRGQLLIGLRFEIVSVNRIFETLH